MAPDDPKNALHLAEAVASGAEEKILLRQLFEGVPAEDMEGLDPASLAELARGRLAFLSERRLGRAKVAISNPEHDFADRTVIDIANDDMPFLVDSVLGLINERNLELKLALHPILAVKRNASGKLVSISDKSRPDPGAIRESLIHIHLARIEEQDQIEALERDLRAILADVRVAVLDWRAMQQKLKDAISRYRADPPPIPIEDLTESIAFLEWLHDDHFTFLGVREYAFEGGAAEGEFEAVAGSGLGILRDSSVEILRRGGALTAMTPEIRDFLMQPSALIITTSDLRSNVHRRAPLDYVGIKLFDKEGDLAGELRVVGLFTSSAYTQSANTIPLLRKKIAHVVARSGFSPTGHSGKALISILENFPRDELFQIDAETLDEIANGMLRLEERPRTRLFVRRDKFDRFVSAFVFIPRDRFDSTVRRKAGEVLAEAFRGHVTSFAPFFGEGTLVRVHFIIERDTDEKVAPDISGLEQKIVDAVRNWDDRLVEAMRRRGKPRELARRWRGAFPPGYCDKTDPAAALADIAAIEALASEKDIGVEFTMSPEDQAGEFHLRLYHLGDAIALSRRVPIIKNLGLDAISETTHVLSPSLSKRGERAVIHDVLMRARRGSVPSPEVFEKLEDGFTAVWTGTAENDAFNALIIAEGLNWSEVAFLRAVARYIRQTQSAYTPDYMAQTLVKHSRIAHDLVLLFRAMFDPGGANKMKAEELGAAIEKALTDVPSLDEDQIIRRFADVLAAMLRTNFYQLQDGTPPIVAFKLDSRRIADLPDPKPFAEIFAYAPDFEGVHLRGGPVARGGIRWSDRPEDFRTEILGLAKAQGVKNAVIVPVGAKGGFVPKRIAPGASREAIQAEGVRVYKRFISTLLDLTDNLEQGKIVPPPRTVRRDGDDPYLVVAADKGTATFSDIANSISQEHGFWLDDAFASGGSAGYDHKKMAITARGAWEAVKRHFREIDIDIESTPFTVVGVGDMSGDVFGNGMLLSRQIKLIAAFDHRDIFIDPNPDPLLSFGERERLFALPRSSWQDYDKRLLSAGGGVSSRQLKSIPLSPEVRAMTGLKTPTATPSELIHALLMAPCDLLWLGGIGTYVKASSESNADAGDRANDAVRIDAAELKARVAGEGANLGFTQKARVEFALIGGRINTDAVDNSAGVNSSDIEVNIKIALASAERMGKLDRRARNAFLAGMTEDVSVLVLRNNYLQTLCLSLAVASGTEENGFAMQLMHGLEKQGTLDRKLESLPGDAAITERDLKGLGLTRPEFAVLMAYAKIALNGEVVASGVPDDPYFARELLQYFPAAMRERFPGEIAQHRLRREIISTTLANSMINRGGPSFVARLTDETNASGADMAMAFVAARDSFDFGEMNALVDPLDGRVAGRLQNELYLELQRALRFATVWFLRHEDFAGGLERLIERYRAGLASVAASLSEALPAVVQRGLAERGAALEKQGVPAGVAERISSLAPLMRAPDVVLISERSGAPVPVVAKALFHSAADLGIGRLIAEGSQLAAHDFIERQAINRLTAQLFQAHRGIVSRVMAESGGSEDAWADWCAAHRQLAQTASTNIDAILASRPFDLARFAVAQGALADLAGH
ncbi:MAG: NAD-glutamate dehydrogenase [Hyphomicrobiales bacterium]